MNSVNVPSWLSVSKESFTIKPSKSRSIILTYNTNGLANGLYNSQITLNHNLDTYSESSTNFNLTLEIDPNPSNAVMILQHNELVFNSRLASGDDTAFYL